MISETTKSKRITFFPEERNDVTKIVKILLYLEWSFEIGEIGSDDLVYGKCFDGIDIEEVRIKSKPMIASRD